MERRRYVPMAEGLEGKALLSTVTAAPRAFDASTRQVEQPTSTSTSTTSPTQSQPQTQASTPSPAAPAVSVARSNSTLPESYSQKLQRIENLPYFLEQLQPGRYLPADTIRSIQENLIAVTARLHGPPSEILDSFNLELRDTIAATSLSAQNSQALNNLFGKALEGAGASNSVVARFKADMNQLAQVDSQSPNPTYLASNDYAVILQTALAVGRPIVTPKAPRLTPTDGQIVGNGAGGATTNPTPTLVGSYEAGASKEGSTRIEILDGNDRVLGSGVVGADGRYSATVAQPLAPGQYNLTARAVDVVGNESKPSPRLVLRVTSRPTRPSAVAQFLTPPRGPMRLR